MSCCRANHTGIGAYLPLILAAFFVGVLGILPQAQASDEGWDRQAGAV